VRGSQGTNIKRTKRNIIRIKSWTNKEALEHVHELIPTHKKRSQGIHQISEELMSEYAMRKAMTINTRQAHRRATSQIPQAHGINTSSTQKKHKPNPTRVKSTKASG
jgi:hypothetical protein